MVSRKDNIPFRLLSGIFLSSAAAISFEITLTRVFSITLWHHFASMIISIGMLGIGLSGTLQSLWPGLKKRNWLGLYAFLLGISMPAGYIVTNSVPLDPARMTWDPLQMMYISVYYIALAVPFFFFGLIVSTALSSMSEKAGTVYGADLLGAGAGALAAFLIISLSGAGTAVFVISILAAIGAMLFGSKKRAFALIILVMLALIVQPEQIRPRMSPYKGLEHALRFPGAHHIQKYETGFSRVDVFNSPAVRFAPGLSIEYLEELPLQLGLSVDGAGLTAITNAAGSSLDFLEHLPSALPYALGTRTRVCIADPRGGLPILMARQYSAREIIAIESNPLIVQVIKNNFEEFSGNIYGQDSSTGLTRSRLQNIPEDFDLIDISLMGTTAAGLFGATEDYRLTLEAFLTYLNHLSPNGLLSISQYLAPPPRAELRVLTTALEALEQGGASFPGAHIAAIRSFATITMIVKKTPLTRNEIAGIQTFSRANSFDLIYYPGIHPEESNIFIQMPDDFYFKSFIALIIPETRNASMRDYVFNVSPVYDDRPFFHYYLRAGKYKKAYDLMGGKWQFFIEEGWLQPAVFVQALVFSIALLLLPAFLGKKRGLQPSPLLLYFAFLGLGFMFVEVPLIQKLILPLENPSYAFATVLCALLVSSGIGSLLGQRVRLLASPRTVLVLALGIITYGFLFLSLSESLASLAVSLRFFLTFVLILPLGFFMGLPFPMGIRALGKDNPGLIPWAWAVNGCFSVLAPLTATMSAMAIGFRSVFVAGAVMYALAYLVLRRAT